MKPQNYNEIIIQKVKEKLPKNHLLVNYLMDTLIIDREPAYRRIRGAVPFSFEEVVKLSKDLSISIDNMVEQSSSNNVVQFAVKTIDDFDNANEMYINMLKEELARMEKLINAKNVEIMVGYNRIYWRFFYCPLLFKGDYFRFLLSQNAIDISVKFSSIEVPQEIMKLYQQIRNCNLKLKNLTVIWESRMFYKIVSEIKKFHQSHFLSDEDVAEIKKELLSFLDLIATSKAKWDIYICDISIDTNCIHCIFDDNEFVQYNIYSEAPVIVWNNKTVSKMQRRWFEKYKKASQQISGTNAFFGSKFYNEMMDFINSEL